MISVGTFSTNGVVPKFGSYPSAAAVLSQYEQISEKVILL